MKMNENGIKERLKFSLLVAFAPLVLRKLNTNKGETPYKPNGKATIHNLGFGLGAGYTQGVSNTWYLPIFKPSSTKK